MFFLQIWKADNKSTGYSLRKSHLVVLVVGIGMESRVWEADIHSFYLDQ
jgi:hypothetical protein